MNEGPNIKPKKKIKIVFYLIIIILSFIAGLAFFPIIGKSDKFNDLIEQTQKTINNINFNELKENTTEQGNVETTKTTIQIIEELAGKEIKSLEQKLILDAHQEDGIKLEKYVIKNITIETITQDLIVASITYDLKPIILNSATNTWWITENGKVEGNWIIGKNTYLKIEKQDGNWKISQTATSSFGNIVNNWTK